MPRICKNLLLLVAAILLAFFGALLMIATEIALDPGTSISKATFSQPMAAGSQCRYHSGSKACPTL